MSAAISGRRFRLLLLLAILVPVLNRAGLGSLQTVLSSDITVPELLPEILGYLSELLAVICAFAGFSCIAAAFLWGGRSAPKKVALLVAAGILVTYLAGALADLGLWGESAAGPAFVLYNVLNIAFELVRVLLVFLCCRRIAGRARAARDESLAEAPDFFSLGTPAARCAAAVTALVALSLLLVHVWETVSLLMTYGGPQNSSEAVYLIFPYAAALIYSMIGYFLTVVFLGFLSPKHR